MQQSGTVHNPHNVLTCKNYAHDIETVHNTSTCTEFVHVHRRLL